MLTMTKRQTLAWLFIRRRVAMAPMIVREHHRDMAGQILADVVAIGQLLPVVLFDCRMANPTEVQLRAVRNSRRRLAAKHGP